MCLLTHISFKENSTSGSHSNSDNPFRVFKEQLENKALLELKVKRSVAIVTDTLTCKSIT